MKPTLTLSILFAGCLLGTYPLHAQTATESSTPAATPARVKRLHVTTPTPTPTPIASPAEPTPTPYEESRTHHGAGKDRVIFGGSTTVAEDETVNDAVVFGGNLDVLGTVTGDAVCFGGRLKLGPHAVVRGDVVNFGGNAEIDPGAKVHGDTVRAGGGVPFNIPFGHITSGYDHPACGLAMRFTGIIWQAAWLAFFAFCALLLTVFLPQHLFRIEEHLTAAFPRSALIGLAAMVGLPLATIILTVTCVGILLVPVLVLIVFVSAVIGYVAFAHILGQRLLSTAGVFVQIVVGLLLLQSAGIFAAFVGLPGGAFATAAHAFHLLDKFIFFVVCFLGLGAVLLSRWGRNALPPQQA